MPGWTQIRGPGHWLGPGNTKYGDTAGWGGVLPSRYSPPSTHPVYHPPGTHPTARTVTSEHGLETAVLGSTKEILGVEYAQVPHVYRSVPHALPYAGPAASSGACSVGPAAVLDRARWRVLGPYSTAAWLNTVFYI